MKTRIEKLFNFKFNLSNFFQNKNEISKETNDKIIVCINDTENKNFDEIFFSNINKMDFFFKKIEEKNKNIKIHKETSEITTFKLKLKDYKELINAYLIFLKDELNIIKEKSDFFSNEVKKLEEKILNYEKEFLEILKNLEN